MSYPHGHADPLAIKVASALHDLSQKHPGVREDVETLLISTPELRGLGTLSISPIKHAPREDPERTLLLFCPEQGGWQTGVFFEGRWLDFATLSVELEPAFPRNHVRSFCGIARHASEVGRF